MSGKRRNVAASVQGFATNPVDKALYDGEATEETDALFSALSSMKGGKKRAAIIPANDGELEFRGWVLTPNGLIAPEDVNQADYSEIGRVLLRLDNAMQWLIGDWINHGDNFQWGETYKRVADEFGYEEATLKDFAYVARNVEMSVRYRRLSFGHHKLVAAMEPDEQAYWLGVAADEGLSIAKLRAAIKASQLPPPPAPTHDIDELNAQMPPGVTVEHVGTYNASNYHEMAGDLARSMANDQRPAGPPMQSVELAERGAAPIKPGDVVQTRTGHLGTVQSVDGRIAVVSNGHYSSKHDVKTLKLAEIIEEADTYAQPDEPAPAGDGFDHEKFTEMQNAWGEARRAFEDVRVNHMAALRGVAGKATRRKTQQQIRDLIAHLHYIESEMEQ